MSQGCLPPAALRTPASPAAHPKGPSQQASPRAHEAFGTHLDRELEPRAAGVRHSHGHERDASALEGSSRAAHQGSCRDVPASAIQRPAAAGTSAEMPCAAGAVAPDPAACPAATADPAALQPEPSHGAAPAAVSLPPAAVPHVNTPGTAAPASQAPTSAHSSTCAPVPASASGGQSGPALPEADPLCAPDRAALGTAVHAVAVPGTTPLPTAAETTPATPLAAGAPQAAPPAAGAPQATPPAAGAPRATPPAAGASQATFTATAQPAAIAAQASAAQAPPAGAGDRDRREPQDRAPGPPATAAAWQHASAPAHASSPVAGTVSVDPGQQAAGAPASSPATAAPAPPPAGRPGVLLSHAAETLRLTIAAANSQGVSRARIALRPAELGGIEIMLAHGPGGLSAIVTAESAQAAHALQKAADELQRTLAEQGLSLARLEINVAGEGAAARRREDRGPAADDHGAGRKDAATDQESDDDPNAARTLELPNGVLVDVLA